MNLDPIEPGRPGVLGRLAEPRHDAGQLVIGQRAGHDIRLLALRRVHLVVLDGQRARRHRLATAVEQRMASAPAVPELEHDPPPRGVHVIGHALPPRDLRLVVDTRLVPEGGASLHCHGGLGDDETRAGPLTVVLGHERAGDVPAVGATASERGHEDAVRRLDGADVKGLEKRGDTDGMGGWGL